MKDRVVFIGDELTASAYRLAGFQVIACDPRDIAHELDVLEEQEPTLVLIASAHADALGMQDLTRRIRRATPPVMVVSDARSATPIPDFTDLIRRRLGVAT